VNSRTALALAAAAMACTGTSPEQAGPIVELSASPSAFLPGEGVALRPVFTAGVGSITPDVGPVESGGSYPVGPSAAGRTYRLDVVAGDRASTVERYVPLRYRERVVGLTAGAARTRHGAARLSDGRLLLVGGSSPTPVLWSTAELFDPVTGGFSSAGELSVTRSGSAVVALPDGGALAVGGETNESTFEPATRVEEWSPETSTWTVVGNLVSNRTRHTATRLADGRVLVVGGFVFGGAPQERDAEIWVPGSGSRQPAGEMLHRRAAHTATLLPDGRVLLAGGFLASTGLGAAEAEIFDPATETFAPAGALNETRAYHAAVLLADGRVLLVGGDVVEAGYRRSAEIWDPDTERFSRTGDLAAARTELDAVALGSGEVLVAGGLVEDTTATAVLEIWDPTTGAFRAAEQSLPAPRAGLSAHLLDDARVLLVGGDPGSGFPVATATIFD